MIITKIYNICKGDEIMDEWISLNEYMKRYKVGYAVVKKMIFNKELETRKTPRRAI